MSWHGISSIWRGKPSFARGIHPPSCKQRSADIAIQTLPTPQHVRIPLHQHAGAPANLTVKPRDIVSLGDVIGEPPADTLGARVHASASGKVQALVGARLPNGRHTYAVPIAVDPAAKDEVENRFALLFGGPWPTDTNGVTRQHALHQIQDGGIVGLGGAAFPTHVKLSAPSSQPIETVLLNGSECEPYLTADYRLMIEAPAAIVAGLQIAMLVSGARSAVVAIEDNKPAAIDALRSVVAGHSGVSVVACETKYPMGGERQLIPAVFRREVPTGGFPADIGICVINVATAAAIASAVHRQAALTHRVLTVSGSGVVRPSNVLTPIGTSFRDVLEFCGGTTDDAVRVVAGGPLMGFTVTDLSVPVTKGTSGIIVLTREEVSEVEHTACIRCGRCLDVCPLHLVPTRIALASQRGDYDLAQKYDLFACCECGCCAYVCPAHIPLVQHIRAGKSVALRR